ncbi:MAG: RNA polymerase sigma-54 factor, partial [Rhodospirillales bacterium]|nr:RNA polymerase sigma-54 factor [Rhodospirillales bacterium]
MALTPRLELRQAQTLVMTPQLQQAIKLLQLSSMELTEYVVNEVERNPLLEIAEGEDTGTRTLEERAQEDRENTESLSQAAEAEGAPLLKSVDLSEPQNAPSSEALDVDYDNNWGTEPGPGGPALGSDQAFAGWSERGGSFEGGTPPDLEDTLAEKPTLREHLLSQIGVDFSEPADRVIGAYLVEMLDESGYFVGSTADAAESLGCAVEKVDEVLENLQRLDPAGIFARSLSECLALQLRDRNRLDPAMQALLDNLDLMARGDVGAMIRRCGVDEEDVRDMIAEIRTLNPKPALAFEGGTV